jgi:hypothetical protein
MADPVSGVCSQNSSDLIESEGEGGMCGGTEGGMSVAPEAATSLPTASSLEEGYIPEYLLADEATPSEGPPKGRRQCPGSQGSNAQSGVLGEAASAEHGVEGVSGNPQETKVDPWGGGNVHSLELGLPFGAGLQLMVVNDEERGLGFVANTSVAASVAKALADGPGVSLMSAYTEYEGSFKEFNDTRQVALNAGAGFAGNLHGAFDEDGCLVGSGWAFGAGAEAGVSISQSTPLYEAFESDDDAR